LNELETPGPLCCIDRDFQVILLTPNCHILNRNPVHFVENLQGKVCCNNFAIGYDGILLVPAFHSRLWLISYVGEILQNKSYKTNIPPTKHQQDPEPVQQIQTEKLVGA
jgi:hypothetical protein